MIDEAELACLGGAIPLEAERQLRLAGLCYGEEERAEAHLKRALDAAPGHAAVLIGFYRFYFYKGRLKDALEVERTCLAKATSEIGLDPDWRKAAKEDANFGNFEAILPRFFMFSLKGVAYLQMRLGNLEEGRVALDKLIELDPADRIGAKVLIGVLEPQDEDD